MNLKAINIMIIFLILSSSLYANADTVEDNIITTKVKTRLMEELDLPAKDIKVFTENSVVKLEGKLETALQANRAIEITSSIDNVLNVDADKLKVKGSDSLMTDAMITAKVKGKILNLYMNNRISGGYDLHVETTNQNVHIYGGVASKEDMDVIKESVRKIAGVKQVNTNLKLK